jgi:hypothetical protein
MHFEELIKNLQTDKNVAITYFRSVGLLNQITTCEGCGNLLREVKSKRHSDGIALRCYKS